MTGEVVDWLFAWFSGACTVWFLMGGPSRFTTWLINKNLNKGKKQKVRKDAEMFLRQEWQGTHGKRPQTDIKLYGFRFRLGNVRKLMRELDRRKVPDSAWLWSAQEGLYINWATIPNLTFTIPPEFAVPEEA